MSLDNQHPFEDDTAERVGVILLDSNENLLVIEGGGGKLSLPKGCRHRGESEWDGAVRECYEETGIDVEDPKIPTKFLKTTKLRYGVYQTIHLLCPGYQIKGSVQEGESSRVFWVNPSSNWLLKNPNLNADLRDYARFKEKIWNRFSRDSPLTILQDSYEVAGCAPSPAFPQWAPYVNQKETWIKKIRAKRDAPAAEAVHSRILIHPNMTV